MIELDLNDYTLSVNNFNEPKVYKQAESLMLLLTRLCLLEPGTFQSHPDMGVGLLTYFRYRVDEGGLAAELKSRILTQIDTYLPILTGTEVYVEIVKKSFRISFVIDGVIFGILYDTTNDSIRTRYQTIADL